MINDVIVGAFTNKFDEMKEAISYIGSLCIKWLNSVIWHIKQRVHKSHHHIIVMSHSSCILCLVKSINFCTSKHDLDQPLSIIRIILQHNHNYIYK
jgi:uncharacterized membrane protein